MKNIWEDPLRRLSWFYPDDGCWLKAELMKENLKKFNKVKVSKIFVFGELKINTNYSAEGQVGWWYHVAAALRFKDEVYILDPTVNQTAPLKLNDWIGLLAESREELKISICHPNTFGPESRCDNRLKEIQILVKSTQKDYLTKEKKRLVELNLDADTYLGDNPPWM